MPEVAAMMRDSIEISKDIVDIPVAGMFASADWKVISREGENYYRACGEKVTNLPGGGESTCIKPVGHMRWVHEDCYGHELTPEFGIEEMSGAIRRSAQYILRQTGIDESEIFNVLNALQYGGFILSRGSYDA